MRLFIFIPGSVFVLLVVFLIGVTRQPLPPEELYPAPENVKEFLRRGDLYEGQGNYEKALADYIQASQLDPDNSQAYLGQASSLSLLDRPAEAIEKYQIMKRLDQANGQGTAIVDYLIQQEKEKLRGKSQ